jgi:hypothetical protein
MRFYLSKVGKTRKARARNDWKQLEKTYPYSMDLTTCRNGSNANGFPTASMDKVTETIAERGKVYGDPHNSHENIGLSWTALIQQHYGLKLDHPLPAHLVAQMMVTFKMQRAARVYHADNYIDAHAYAKFAEDSQQRE